MELFRFHVWEIKYEIQYNSVCASDCHHFLPFVHQGKHISEFLVQNLLISSIQLKMSWQQETIQYYNWLMRIQSAEFGKELLEIVSFPSEIYQLIISHGSPSVYSNIMYIYIKMILKH